MKNCRSKGQQQRHAHDVTPRYWWRLTCSLCGAALASHSVGVKGASAAPFVKNNSVKILKNPH